MKKISFSRLSFIAGAIWILLGTISWLSASFTYLRIVQYAGITLFANSLVLLTISYTCHSSVREKEWVMADACIDLLFAIILSMHAAFSLFFFPFLLCGWMALKGLLKMLESLSIAGTLRNLNGDFMAGFLLILFTALASHDPIGRPSGIAHLFAMAACTIGALYWYDSLRAYRIERQAISRTD